MKNQTVKNQKSESCTSLLQTVLGHKAKTCWGGGGGGQPEFDYLRNIKSFPGISDFMTGRSRYEHSFLVPAKFN